MDKNSALNSAIGNGLRVEMSSFSSWRLFDICWCIDVFLLNRCRFARDELILCAVKCTDVVHWYNRKRRHLDRDVVSSAVMSGFDLAWLSSLSCERLCVFDLHDAVYIVIFFGYILLHLSVSWAWWDWPLTWLTNHRPSMLWHCWLWYTTCKIIFKISCDVSSGTLAW